MIDTNTIPACRRRIVEAFNLIEQSVHTSCRLLLESLSTDTQVINYFHIMRIVSLDSIRWLLSQQTK